MINLDWERAEIQP